MNAPDRSTDKAAWLRDSQASAQHAQALLDVSDLTSRACQVYNLYRDHVYCKPTAAWSRLAICVWHGLMEGLKKRTFYV